MKKLIFLFAILFASINAKAQVNEKELLEKSSKAAEKAIDTSALGWKRVGNLTFLFNQSAFNKEWLGGGTSSIAGNLGLNYDFNYNSRNSVWDNKIIVTYGLTKLGDGPTLKSDDRLEFTSLYGKKAGQGYWYYSGFLNFKTQLDSGFDPKTGTKISHFFSPAYLQIGPGMLWKRSDNLKVNIAPATSRLIFVNKQFTEFGTAFGVEKGKTSRFEFGAALNVYYKLTVMENITIENILNLYSNYLDKPSNIDVDYQMNLVMKINKYMSANLSLQAIYDDNAITKVQVREVFGFGVNYGF